MQDSKFKSLIGKKIECVCRGKRYVGHLQFAGINGLHGTFQVTMNRMPLWPVNPKSIKLYKHWSNEI